MKLHLLALALCGCLSVSFLSIPNLQAKLQPTTAYIPPPLLGPESNGHELPHIIQQPAQPGIVNGKPVSELSDDELHEFLESKIQTVEQEEGQVELLRIAPGYALTLAFEENVQGVVLGDSALVSYHLQNQKTLVLAATQREGDTSMTLVMPGGKLLNYHVFITPDFIEAQTSLKVMSNTLEGDGSGMAASHNAALRNQNSLYVQPDGTPNIKALVYTIANYEALIQEKAIDHRIVKRTEVFKKSNVTSFTVFYLYHFAAGPIVVTFSYKNPFHYPVRYDESRLRIQLGNMQFVPDYITLRKTVLRAGESTTGIAIVNTPALRVNQSFELLWK